MYWKVNYYKVILVNIIKAVSSYMEKTTVTQKTAYSWFTDVTSGTIVECFRKKGFCWINTTNIMVNVQDTLTDKWNFIKEKTEFSKDITLYQYIIIYKDILITEPATKTKL